MVHKFRKPNLLLMQRVMYSKPNNIGSGDKTHKTMVTFCSNKT